MIPAVPIKPAERCIGYPVVFIIGSNIAATAAVSATAEPDKLAIIIALKIATNPSPPRL
ncbi:hypothetical protein BVZ79_00047 [Haemophilus influenzae]|nr:hypothetical protein BVZ79_00047 [Haemophilus influenzae]